MLKRILSLFLSVVMIITMLPVQAIAQEEETQAAELVLETEPEEITVPTEPVTESAEEATAPTEPVTEPAEDTTISVEPMAELVGELEEIHSGTCGENIQWILDKEGNLRIEGTGEMEFYTAVYDETSQEDPNPDAVNDGPNTNVLYYTTPWLNIDGIKVKSVYISDGVTSIGSHAFSTCDQLTEVRIPDSVNFIGMAAFSYCTSLEEIDIPESVAIIDNSAFFECRNLKNIRIPQNVSNMANYIFYNCQSLSEITFCGDVPNFFMDTPQLFYGVTATAYYPANNPTWTADRLQNYGGNITWVPMEEETEDLYSGTCGEELVWSFADGVLTISGTGWMDYWHLEDEVPWYHLQNEITDVVIGDGVSNIGRQAFLDCDNISGIEIPATVLDIGYSAFFDCDNLNSVDIPDSVTGISYFAFFNCGSLSSVEFPASLASIEEAAFARNLSLKEIHFEGNAPYIAEHTFAGVTADAYYPANNATWTEAVLQNYGGELTWKKVGTETEIIASGTCGENLTWILDMEGTMTISGTGPMTEFDYAGAPWYPFREDIRNVVIGDGATTISSNSFEYCDQMVSISIPDTVTAINSYFYYCTSLASIYIPESVRNIAGFMQCSSLSNIEVADGNPNYSAVDNVLFNKDQTMLIFCPMTKMGAYTIPNSVTEISTGAFSDCKELISVTVPKSVSVIPFQAFQRCEKLETVKLPGRLTKIEGRAFYECSALRNVMIPGSVETIEASAFAYCTALESIVIPESVKHLEAGAFSCCRVLNTITFEGDAPVSDPEEIHRAGEICFAVTADVYYPADSTGWTDEVKQCFGGNLTWIAVEAEDPNSGTCGDHLTWRFDADTATLTISGTGEMYDYTNEMTPWHGKDLHKQIRSVIIEDGVTSISHSAFAIFSKLEEITIGAAVTSVGALAFQDCTALKRITFAGNKPAFGENTFLNVNASGYYRISDFSWYSLPQEKYGAQDLVWIPYGAYSGSCGDNLTWCYDPDWAEGTLFINGIGQMYDYAEERAPWFADDLYRQISYVQIGDGVTTIGANAFDGFTTMEYLVIGKDVISIGAQAMKDCTSMIMVGFTGNAPEIAADAFRNVRTTAEYPGGNRTWTDDVRVNYGGSITWVSDGTGENRVNIDRDDLNGQTSVWIDGKEYPVEQDGETCYVDLPDGNAKTMIVYTYHEGDGSDIHTQYPVSMSVWTLENENGFYTATRQDDFDNILQYAGSSIRVTGKTGIRMITSINREKKNALVSGGLAGYTLKEYGTAVAWANQISDDKPLVLGKSYVKSNYAYKRGVADPVFSLYDNMVQYTNVLVNFSNEQCKQDIAMRPYMILTDNAGNQITLYGGIVYRSIGYIAYQNRNTFKPDTDAYEYVWNIIHVVYGDIYDNEYAPSWTPPSM